MVFTVYNSRVLFPAINATEQVQGTNASITTVVGSPILGTIVGAEQNFRNLTEPVTILLQFNELEVGDWNMCEKCLYISVYLCELLTGYNWQCTTIDSYVQFFLYFLHRMSQVCLDVSLGISILQVWTQYWIELVTILSRPLRLRTV